MKREEELNRYIGLARKIREYCEGRWSENTRAKGYSSSPPSSGHCAVVAALVNRVVGLDILTGKTSNGSHWLNRAETENGETIYVDVTGDQFGGPEIYVSYEPPNYIKGALKLYSRPIGRDLNSRIYKFINADTEKLAGYFAEGE